MKTRARNSRFNSPCRNNRSRGPERRGRERGYVLLVLMIAVTVLLISLTAVLPDIYTEGQRAKEEELIFRGNEYARAIALYHVRFNRYPMKIDDLIKGVNGIRFLRRAYPDPMTKSGKWRYIHANAAGAVVDSRTLPMGGIGGGTGGPGGAMGAGLGGAKGGASSSFSSGFSLGPMGGGTGDFGSGVSGSGSAESGPGEDNGPPQGNPLNPGITPGGTGPAQGTTPSMAPGPTSGFGFSNETSGLFIVGVASTSRKKSFRILNISNKRKDHYDDWEFLGLPMLMQGASPMPGMPGGPGAVNPQSGMGGNQPAGAFPPILGNPTTNP